jgi:tetratricopeptide (TPR) repeat protein
MAQCAAGELSDDELEVVEEHVDGCDTCRRLVRDVLRAGDEAADVAADTTPASRRPVTISHTSSRTQVMALAASRRGAEIRSAWLAAPPAQLGPYRILGRLGSGGMGVVYRAQHVDTGLEAAVKTVLVPYGSELAGLRSEIHSLARLRHPGIVRVLGEGVYRGLPWYAMELLKGRTLADFASELGRADDRAVAAGGRLADVTALARRLCAPLAFLHGRGIVHRDLKPSNVFIRDDGTPVVMDFGLVARFEGAVGREVIEVAGAVSGTAAYMSPEQATGQFVDARSDLYALGCILYELVVGRPPFWAASSTAIIAQHVGAAPVPPSERVAGVPPALDRLILRLLAKEPAARIGHADDVEVALAEIDGAALPAAAAARGYLYRPQLAGREGVLDALAARLAAARDGRGSFVLIGGESGLGKTYLAATVCREATLRGMRVITGECLPLATLAADVRGAPLHPLRRLFEALADLCRERGRAGTEALLGARGPILAAYEPALGQLPGQSELPPPRPVPAEAERARLLAALTGTLAALADDRPLLLVVDDLQWADELSLSFLTSLDGRYLGARPLVVLGTYRSEEVGESLRALVESRAAHGVRLAHLDEATVARVVGDMLAIPDPPAAFIGVLARRSGGNPFFVAELLRTAVAERLLFRERGTWRVSAGELPAATQVMYEALPLPTSLRDLIGRRLGMLSERSRRLVEVAAVVGREVAGALLAEVGGAAADEVLDALEELLARQVLDEAAPGHFRFVHDKLREIAYAGIAPERRRALHRGAARALEAAGDPAQMSSELAHHFTEAGDVRKAIHYLEAAGAQAARSFANQETINFLTRALALDAGSPEPVPALRRAAWERAVGSAYLGLGRALDGDGHLLRAAALLGWGVPGSRLGLVAGAAGAALRQLGHRVRRPRHERLAPGRRAALLEAARTYDVLMPVSYFANGQLARILFAGLMNLNLAERLGPSPELARAYATAHVSAGLIPWPRLAAAYWRRAEEVLDEVGDPDVQSWAYVLGGSHACGAAAFATALGLSERAEALARQMGYPRRIEEAVGVRGNALMLSGRFEAARDTSLQVLESGLRGDPQTQVWGLDGSAQACLRLGEHRRALELAEQAVALLGHDLGRPERIFAHGVLALAALRSGDAGRARAEAESSARAIAAGTPIAFYCIPTYSFVAEVFLELWAAGDASLAAAARRSCRDVVRSARVFPVHGPSAGLLWGRYLARAGDGGGARRAWRRGLEAARRLGMSYEERLISAELEAAGAGDARRGASAERPW